MRGEKHNPKFRGRSYSFGKTTAGEIREKRQATQGGGQTEILFLSPKFRAMTKMDGK